jgi:hypothetical protein
MSFEQNKKDAQVFARFNEKEMAALNLIRTKHSPVILGVGQALAIAVLECAERLETCQTGDRIANADEAGKA